LQAGTGVGDELCLRRALNQNRTNQQRPIGWNFTVANQVNLELARPFGQSLFQIGNSINVEAIS
jgi:hypothetical protein